MGADEVEIRALRVEDQDAAKALILAGLEEHWGVLDPSLNPDLDDIAASYRDAVFLVACINGEMAGTGALVPEAGRFPSGASGAGSVARIVRMSVARSRRRQGIGRLLLDELCRQARALGCRTVVLETTADWQDAIAFYLRCGFRASGFSEGDIHFKLDL